MHESKKLIPAENAPLPQLDRGTDYESVRRGFESLTAHHLNGTASATTGKRDPSTCGFFVSGGKELA